MNLAAKHPRQTRAVRWLAAAGIAMAVATVTSRSHAQTFAYSACRDSAYRNLDYCVSGSDGHFERARCGVYFYYHVEHCSQL